ncbi:MAG: 6-bladed beta-propeller, partial [Tannerellaceae bacterium]
MKHTTTLRFALLTCIALNSCSSKPKTGNDNSSTQDSTTVMTRADSIAHIENTVFPIYIEKEKDYEVKRITLLQDIGKVEYIPLETKEECFLGASHSLLGIELISDNIFIATHGGVSRFDTSGKYLNNIGVIGPGPEEVKLIGDFKVDKSNHCVYIIDVSRMNIQIYDYDGNYIKGIRFEAGGDSFDKIDDESILFANLFTSINPSVFQVSLSNGNIIKEILPARQSHSGIKVKFYDKFVDMLQYNNRLIYQGFTSDTIFTIDKATLTTYPRYIQLPPNTGEGDLNSNPFVLFETDRYAYLAVCRNPPLEYNYVIDKKENIIYKGFIADADRGTAMKPINTNRDNVIADM